ncbi:MAG TPA: molybdopterin cofactor-binding domain-containing protein, partial [Alphaproteobacteria bacterium]
GAVPPIHCLRLLSNVYVIPAIYAEARAVFTHTAPTGTYRGAGRPEATYLVERLIEGAARSMGVDPVALRRRNLIAPAAMPYKTHSDITYDVGEFEIVLDKALALADRGGFAARRAASERCGRRRGLGIGHYVELSALFNERMGLRVESDGSVVIASGTFSHGQGHETTYAQIVSDWLGVPIDRIRLEQGDTAAVPYGRGTFAARSLTVAVPALRAAADEIIAKGKRFAAQLLEASEADIEFADAAFGVAGTDRRIPLAAVARASQAPAGPLAAIGPIGLEGVGTAQSAENYPNGCHVCEVEVDVETGAVEVKRFAAIDDVGVAVNPMLVDGQVHGGIAQGLGQALMEEVAYDRATGQLLTGSFLDYAMPRASDFPRFDVALHEVPTKSNPLGVKGAGEAGCVGAPAAAVNAILDALAPLGVTHIEMPATPERVWRAIRAANGAA